MSNKFLPESIEVEESILGGILFDPSVIERVAEILAAEAFFLESHQQIYKATLELYYQDKPTDLITVSTWLSDHKLLKKVGGNNKLSQLLEKIVSAANIDHYAELVLEKYQRRLLIAAADKISELAHDTGISIKSVIEESEEKIFSITTNEQDKFKPQTIRSCLVSALKKLEQGQVSGIPTGLLDLDTLTGGLIKQDLIVVAARASMGKTWLACHFANYVATEQKLPVVFFSAEMSKEQLSKRFLAMHTGIDSQRLMRNEIYQIEYDKLIEGIQVLSELPIIIDDTPASMQNPARMCSALRRIQSEQGSIGLVVMDYIQKLGDRAASNRAQLVGKFSGAFKDIAKEFDVPFIALAQINRGVESQSNKRPTMADIKDSGDIEQDMDVGLLLYRNSYYNPETEEKDVMEINVAKNRNGPTGTCKILFNPCSGKFMNIVAEESFR